MNEVIRITVPGQPQGKGRARVCLRGGYARAYTPDSTAAYENLIKLAYGNRGISVVPVELAVTAYYRIPKSFSKRKRTEALSGVVRPQTKPDIDNVVKVVCDALNKVAYNDDTQVVKIVAEKYYGETPGLVVEIKEVGYGRD